MATTAALSLMESRCRILVPEYSSNPAGFSACNATNKSRSSLPPKDTVPRNTSRRNAVGGRNRQDHSTSAPAASCCLNSLPEKPALSFVSSVTWTSRGFLPSLRTFVLTSISDESFKSVLLNEYIFTSRNRSGSVVAGSAANREVPRLTKRSDEKIELRKLAEWIIRTPVTGISRNQDDEWRLWRREDAASATPKEMSRRNLG